MAVKHHASKTRSTRNRSAAGVQSASPPTLDALHDAIEVERLRLMKAHSVLGCAVTAMEADDVSTGDGPYYPALIEVAGDLVNEAIRQLDSVSLRHNAALLMQAEAAEDEDEAVQTPRGPSEVREPRVEYVVTREREAPALEVTH